LQHTVTTTSPTTPIAVDDPINARILAVSEDRITGFRRRPFREIAERSGVELDTVLGRIQAMLDGGVIRRVRQTLLSTQLAPGALVAWSVPGDRLNDAFEFMAGDDPFSGHVVLRSTDAEIEGARFKLWTTLKVPQGFSMTRHCDDLADQVGADAYRIMPAKRLFKLGVGHVRRRTMAIGEKAGEPAEAVAVRPVALDEMQWRVVTALKREFTPDEIHADPWRRRAEEAGLDVEEFCEIARQLNARGVVGRFSTFLEHVKSVAGSKPVTRYNALFHWAVPAGREIEAGGEVGRFHILTHAYWREAGPAFNDVNIMAVAHGTDRDRLLAHKQAIDHHLAACGIAVSYTNVFWGGRSEIKPSEIVPAAYVRWCESRGIDPDAMRA